MLLSGLPRQLDSNTICLGSSSRDALVRIDGADAVHAEITSRRVGFGDPEWWISDRDSSSGTLLNGERLERPTCLCNGDRITIADVDILFSGGWLREDHSKARGVKVCIQGVSDERNGKVILRSVDASVDDGEFVGILGPSGCGKSSVIQRIAGLAPFNGHISINGHSVGEDDLRRLIAYLPQNVENALHDGLTVREEMDCNRRLYLAPSADDVRLDADYLDTLGLAAEIDKPIGRLSGGQKRRVAIALALQRQPQLLLLDEPTAGLDPATETEVMQYLRKLSRQGRTVLCATHVMENLSLFDKVLLLTGGEENGKAVYFGSPYGVLEHFGVGNYPALYAKLRDESKTLAVSAVSPTSVPDPWTLPEPPAQASFVRTVIGYLRRFSAEFVSSIFHPTASLDKFLPKPLRTLCLQPILIVVGIKWACADMFGKNPIGGLGGISTVLFCAALSMFWLGLVGSVQSLVRERVPGRCLERLGGISLARYGTAKVMAILSTGFVQTALFALLFFYLPELGKCEETSKLSPSIGVALVLYLVCLMGSVVGLAVSAVSKSTTAAVAAVPVVAILALFFSQPVIGFRVGEEQTAAVKVAQWMPCHKAQVCMSVLEGQPPDNKAKENALPNFLVLFMLYAFTSIALTAVAQRKNESRWDGR